MRIRRMAALGLAVVALSTAAAACGDDDEEASEATSAAAPAETSVAAEPATSAAAETSAAESAPAESSATESAPAESSAEASAPVSSSSEPLEIAYLSASTANTWLQASLAKMQEVAEARGANITEFDAQFKPEEQTKQLQDAIAADKYDGIVVAAINGVGLIPDLQAAMDAGIEVAVLNQVVGEKLDTPDPQVEGITTSVLAPPLRSGERFGKLALEACEGKDPCRVVYFYGIKGIPLDEALRQGFDQTIAENPAITVVDEAEGQYLGPDVGLEAMQTVLTATPDFDVVVGSDQSMQGAQQALEDAGKLDKVSIIGLGGSEPAIQAVKDGKWFGDVYGAPGTEGEIAMTNLLDKLQSGTDGGGVDPLTTIEDEGLITQANIDKFTAEWAG